MRVTRSAVDRFKTINDRHGHHVRDRALKTFAACCSRVTRAEDVVGLAERLLEEIRSAKTLHDQGGPVSLNASIDVACLRADHPVDLYALLHQTDWAMLNVKRSGRGRIGTLEAPGAEPAG